AVRSGMAVVHGDAVLAQYAELEHNPADLRDLLPPLRAREADAVYGSRFQGGPRRVLYFWHFVGNSILTLLSNMFTNLNLTDLETCYKLVRTDLLEHMPLSPYRLGL